jgi:hypothetical protein
LPAPFGALFDPPLELLPGLLLEVPFDPLDCAAQTVAQSNPVTKNAITGKNQPKWRGTVDMLITFLVVPHCSPSLKLRNTPAKSLRPGPKWCCCIIHAGSLPLPEFARSDVSCVVDSARFCRVSDPHSSDNSLEASEWVFRPMQST